MSDPGYRYLNSRQILNNLALAAIGSPTNDNLADILTKINDVLAGISGGAGYIAKKVALTVGTWVSIYRVGN